MVITIQLTDQQAESLKKLSRFGSPEEITRKAFAVLSLYSKEEEGTQIAFVKNEEIIKVITGL